ncbi:ATP-binding protein [Actinomycetes bacterium KLBMP 9797]
MTELTDVPERETLAYARAGDLAAVRAFVAARATAEGLPPERVSMLTLAISELATNTLQHTAGGGRVRVWVDGKQLVVDVVDGGPGALPLGRGMPAPDALRGRGLAIVERLCDVVEVSTGAEGTRVRVRVNLVTE